MIYLKYIEMLQNYRCLVKGSSFIFTKPLSVLVGENGSGKTSLINLISYEFNALIRNGVKIDKPYSVYEGKVCMTYAKTPFKVLHYDSHDREKRNAGYFGVDAFTQFEQLYVSSGQGMFIGLLNELERNYTKESLILLDDPTKGLDALNTCIVAEMLRILLDSGNQIIVATNDSLLLHNISSIAEFINPQFMKSVRDNESFLEKRVNSAKDKAHDIAELLISRKLSKEDKK